MSRPERVFGSRAPSFWIQLRHKNDIVWHTTVVRKMFPEGTADDTIPHRDIEETKATEPLPSSLPSPSSPPVSPRPSRDQCPFCFFEDRLPPVDRDRHYARIDSLRRHVLRVHLKRLATTTAFEVFISLTPRSRNQSSVQSLPVAGWSCKVKITTRVIRLRYIRGLSKAIGL